MVQKIQLQYTDAHDLLATMTRPPHKYTAQTKGVQ